MTEPSEAAKAKAEAMQSRIDAWDEVARFIQQVSDAAKARRDGNPLATDPFILPELVDPLTELFRETFANSNINELGGYARFKHKFRDELAKRGLKIVKDESA